MHQVYFSSLKQHVVTLKTGAALEMSCALHTCRFVYRLRSVRKEGICVKPQTIELKLWVIAFLALLTTSIF